MGDNVLVDIKLNANVLNKQYEVRGSYYILKYPGGAILGCRNALEISTKNTTQKALEVTPPDAIFVMMNPGCSRPWDKEYEPPVYTMEQITERVEVPRIWTKAKPDITQYQVMKVMTYMGWNRIRVGNLSDIRCPKSLEFRDIVRTLTGPDPDGLHSIFSQKRKTELDWMLQRKERAPIVMAWGSEKWLSVLATTALGALPSNDRIGVASDKSGLLFSHASPSLQKDKDIWVRGILKVLRCNNTRHK
jgi:hypothetical protein